MLNYHKTYRESLDKSKKRPTPKKQPTINRSHTSSINLKLSADLDQMKASMKNFKQNQDPLLRKDSIVTQSKSKSNIKNQHTASTSQFKYSFKIKQDPDYYDGSRVRMKTNYQQTAIKPFRESNRCLITERNEKPSDYKFCEKSLPKKADIHLRTQYKESSEHQDFSNNQFNKYDQNDLRSRKQSSTKHNTQSLSSNSNPTSQMVKIPLNQLKKLYEQYKQYENEVALLQKEVNFYRKTAGKPTKNTVAMALAD